jgi:hypothetical protein
MSNYAPRPGLRNGLVVVCALVLAAVGKEARAGLVIIPTFESSMNAQQEAAVNYVINQYETLYTNNITLRIDFSMGQTGLGESESYFEDGFTYSQVKAALTAEALANPSDTIKQTVVANLPATNPAPSNNFAVTTAQAKALGLDESYNGLDGYVIFSNAVSYTYDPNNRGVAGEYDFIGVAEHEISEVMGRDALLGYDFGDGNGPSYEENDLFRFTAPGVRSFAQNVPNDPGVYLSVDNGNTDTVNFWSQSLDNDDYRGDNPTDPYNQYAGEGQAHQLTYADMVNMDALGYNVATPEPASLTLLTSGFLAFGGLRVSRRRRRQTA